MRVTAYNKFLFSAAMAGITALAAALSDDVLSVTDLVSVALAVLTALGVYVVPNSPAGPNDPVV